MSTRDGGNEARGSRGVELGLQILEFLAGWKNPDTLPRPALASLHEIASTLAIPEPTAHRIVQALLRGGWVEKAGNEYRLAFKVGLIGVGIHEALRRQAETTAGMARTLDMVKALGETPLEEARAGDAAPA